MEPIELKGHTEGPWCASWYQSDDTWGVDDGEDCICDCYWWDQDKKHRKQYKNAEANARLIAAAPTLLAIANEIANKLAMAGQPAQAFESFASRGIKPPALVMREALGYDEPPAAEGRDGE